MVSDTDGGLYDTRAQDWHGKPPLRALYRRGFPTIDSVAKLKATLRYGPFTHVGAYPIYFITSGGECLSFESVEENLTSVLWSIKNEVDDGWRVVGCEVNYEAEICCSHSGKPIESTC